MVMFVCNSCCRPSFSSYNCGCFCSSLLAFIIARDDAKVHSNASRRSFLCCSAFIFCWLFLRCFFNVRARIIFLFSFFLFLVSLCLPFFTFTLRLCVCLTFLLSPYFTAVSYASLRFLASSRSSTAIPMRVSINGDIKFLTLRSSSPFLCCLFSGKILSTSATSVSFAITANISCCKPIIWFILFSTHIKRHSIIFKRSSFNVWSISSSEICLNQHRPLNLQFC
mmetsp:Transcript_6627/g.10495  ORF Transcript_6627/g.10495 Transcript_6627/m.10495 type:complete len:224 (+) Transcript_6627:438-1109(+)